MAAWVESLRRHLALLRSVQRARSQAGRPFKLTWILGESCSLTCRTCDLWRRPAPGPTLTQVRAVIAANPGFTWVNLSGGDFVERGDAPALVEAVANGFPDLALLDFPTAGQEPEAVLDALQPALASAVPRIFVSVSLDGPDAVHDAIRGRRGAATRARETLRRLRSIRRRGLRVVVGTTLSRHNAGPAGSVETALPPHIPARDLHVNLAHHSPHYYRNGSDLAPDPDLALAVLDDLTRRGGLRLDPLGLIQARYRSLLRRYLRSGDVGGACGALVASVFLAADLTVYPCSIFSRSLGKLGEGTDSLAEILTRAEARRARALAVERACPGCWSPCEAFPTLLVGLGRPL